MNRIKENARPTSPALPQTAASFGRGRTRAHADTEKEARRQDILDAADKLFAERQEMSNMADVAVAARLAKGTMYLYFQSKEELYLALHLRHVEHFFARLIARLDRAEAFGFAEMQSLADQHILGTTTYLPLGACCIGFPAGTLRPEVIAHFQGRLAEWLSLGGTGLERHFPKLAQGEGVRLLKHSYAIMIGLYGLTRNEQSDELACPRFPNEGSFQDETRLALTRYWAHVAGIADTAAERVDNLQRDQK
ncbi:MAG: TetR/AcrR family transcriptional regulator [Betaproteobacteria bacterium]|nr:TetR/AcrR family transcriptional regulator [Betaproteobacteria bacterium]